MIRGAGLDPPRDLLGLPPDATGTGQIDGTGKQTRFHLGVDVTGAEPDEGADFMDVEEFGLRCNRHKQNPPWVLE